MWKQRLSDCTAFVVAAMVVVLYYGVSFTCFYISKYAADQPDRCGKTSVVIPYLWAMGTVYFMPIVLAHQVHKSRNSPSAYCRTKLDNSAVCFVIAILAFVTAYGIYAIWEVSNTVLNPVCPAFVIYFTFSQVCLGIVMLLAICLSALRMFYRYLRHQGPCLVVDEQVPPYEKGDLEAGNVEEKKKPLSPPVYESSNHHESCEILNCSSCNKVSAEQRFKENPPVWQTIRETQETVYTGQIIREQNVDLSVAVGVFNEPKEKALTIIQAARALRPECNILEIIELLRKSELVIVDALFIRAVSDRLALSNEETQLLEKKLIDDDFFREKLRLNGFSYDPKEVEKVKASVLAGLNPGVDDEDLCNLRDKVGYAA